MVRNRARSFFAQACAATAFVLISACAPIVAPQGVVDDKAVLTKTYLLARDGEHLPLRIWPADHPKAILVALHGMGDYSNAFAMPAPFWASEGITTLAYDQRGFGQSDHYGLWASGDVMRHDFADAIEAARTKYPDIPIYALGESMGGAVVLSALAQTSPPKPDGVILVAPAVWSRADMPLSYRAALWLGAHLFPAMTVSGGGLEIWPSDNISMLRAYSRDPWVQKQTRTDAVWGLVNLMDEARYAPNHLKNPPPILFLYGANDQIIPAPPTEAVITALDGMAEVKRYDHGYHMLLRDLDRQGVWNDVAAWILKNKPNKGR